MIDVVEFVAHLKYINCLENFPEVLLVFYSYNELQEIKSTTF